MYIDFSENFKVLAPAPSPFPLIKVGLNGDGAYLIPDDLKGISCCFSAGLGPTKQFEDHLANCYGIKSYIADPISTLDQLVDPLIPGFQFYDQLSIGLECFDGGPSQSLTLEQWVDRYASTADCDLILKMDIEGGEYDALLPAPACVLNRFRIIVIEVHWLEVLASSDYMSSGAYLLLEKLAQTHVCIHVHPNNCCGQVVDSISGMNIPRVMEFTYLRRDRFAEVPDSSLLGPFLPHPLDISRNVLGNAPIALNHHWYLAGLVPSVSREKALSDEVEYLQYANVENARLAQAEVVSLRGELDTALTRSDLLVRQVEDMQYLCMQQRENIKLTLSRLNWNRAQLNVARNLLIGYRRLFEAWMRLRLFT